MNQPQGKATKPGNRQWLGNEAEAVVFRADLPNCDSLEDHRLGSSWGSQRRRWKREPKQQSKSEQKPSCQQGTAELIEQRISFDRMPVWDGHGPPFVSDDGEMAVDWRFYSC